MKAYLFLKKTTLVIALGLCNLVSSAQAPAVQWDKSIGGNSGDYMFKLIPTADGGYLTGGYSFSGMTGDKTQAPIGYWVVKLDAGGNKLWDKTFSGNGNNVDKLISLAQTVDDGYILGGYSDSGIFGDKSQANFGNWDYWVIRLDASGNKLWDKTFGGSDDDRLQSLIQTTDGGFILGGFSKSGISGNKTQANKGDYDYWVVKLDAAGTKLWDKTLGGTDQDALFSLSQTSDGGYFLGGSSKSGISGDKTEWSRGGDDYWVVKLDVNGNKVWDKTFGGQNFDFLHAAAQTVDGGYIIGGFTSSPATGDKTQQGNGGEDYWVLKLDAAGTKLWDTSIGGLGNDQMLSLSQTTDSGYILLGSSDSPVSGDKTEANKGGRDYWAVKVNAAGIKLWDKTIGGSNQESDFDGRATIAQTPDGGYILGGGSNSDVSGDKT